MPRRSHRSSGLTTKFAPAKSDGRLIIILMGVSGAGKTTVGQLLAAELGWDFADADNYHSAANIEKMRTGIPLDDTDRTPWLETLRQMIANAIDAGKNIVLACSALKRSYRDLLRVGPEVRFVYLKVLPPLLHERLRERRGHYMTEQMLASQLATLEEPQHALVIDASPSPAAIANDIRIAIFPSFVSH
jgi:gluconokinase